MAGQSKTRSTAKPPAINAAKLPALIDIALIDIAMSICYVNKSREYPRGWSWSW